MRAQNQKRKSAEILPGQPSRKKTSNPGSPPNSHDRPSVQNSETSGRARPPKRSQPAVTIQESPAGADSKDKFHYRPRVSEGAAQGRTSSDASKRCGVSQLQGLQLQGPQPQGPQPQDPPPQTLQPHAPPHNSFELIKQPETRPISQEQLVAEVKGIYAGLVMVESKCIEVDNAQNAAVQAALKLNNEQWMALIALHRTLLHEHHDFFLASQHPSASEALKKLASKYAMPARMWRHGIHSFLEVLKHRLPASLEHMLAFIYLAYSMMALMYETVPAYEDTWIECLGDLGRYRMAIEDNDIRDQEIWTQVSRHWYSRASNKSPTTGRLYHHLAILARPNAIQQLFLFVKSLCVPTPFEAARESIRTLFDPILSNLPSRLPAVEVWFVYCHGILFSKKHSENFQQSVAKFTTSLDPYIAQTNRRWLEGGYHIAIANCCALLGYGDENNLLMRAMKPHESDETQDHTKGESGDNNMAVWKQLYDAQILVNGTHDIIFRRSGDPNVLPYIHVSLVFIFNISHYPEALRHIAPAWPWELLSQLLNTLLVSFAAYDLIENEAFPLTENLCRPFPEDYAMRGLPWADKYFPNKWFSNDKTDDDDKYMEAPSMYQERVGRILWLAVRIAGGGHCLRYDSTTHQFDVTPEFDTKVEMRGDDKDGDGETLADDDSGTRARDDEKCDTRTRSEDYDDGDDRTPVDDDKSEDRRTLDVLGRVFCCVRRRKGRLGK